MVPETHFALTKGIVQNAVDCTSQLVCSNISARNRFVNFFVLLQLSLNIPSAAATKLVLSTDMKLSSKYGPP
jgi:hypothetical protein